MMVEIIPPKASDTCYYPRVKSADSNYSSELWCQEL